MFLSLDQPLSTPYPHWSDPRLSHLLRLREPRDLLSWLAQQTSPPSIIVHLWPPRPALVRAVQERLASAHASCTWLLSPACHAALVQAGITFPAGERVIHGHFSAQWPPTQTHLPEPPRPETVALFFSALTSPSAELATVLLTQAAFEPGPNLHLQVQPDFPEALALARRLSRSLESLLGFSALPGERNLSLCGVPWCAWGEELRKALVAGKLPGWLRLLPTPGEGHWPEPLPPPRFAYRQVSGCECCVAAGWCPGLAQVLTEETAPPPLLATPRPQHAPPSRLALPLAEPPGASGLLGGSPWAALRRDMQLLAVRSGLKPAVRYLLPVAAADERARQFQQQGQQHGMQVRFAESRFSYDHERKWLVPNPAGERRILYVGRSASHLDELAHAEAAVLAQSRLDEEASRGLHEAMGALLGYPECCTRQFNLSGQEQNTANALAAWDRSQRRSYLLNTLALSHFSYVPWSPCRFDCEASLQYAQQLERELAREYPRLAALARHFLLAPRLLVAERQMLTWQCGSDPEQGERVWRALLPWQIDGQRQFWREEQRFAAGLPGWVWAITRLDWERCLAWDSQGRCYSLAELPGRLIRFTE